MANLFIETVNMSKCKANQDGDFIIGVIGNPSDVLITIFLAILKTGAAYLPIDPQFPRSRLEHILNDSKPILVLYDENYKFASSLESYNTMKFEDIFRELITMGMDNITEERLLTPDNANQKALICYTSGTTGVMKGVRLSHRTLYQRIHWQILNFPFDPSETHCVFKTPASFIDHVGELWCPIVSSKTLVVLPRDDVTNVEKFISILEANKVQRLVLVPSLLRNILIVLKAMTAAQSDTSSKRASTSSKRESILTQQRESTRTSKRDSENTKQLLMNLRLWISSGDILSTNLVSDFFEYFTGDAVLVNCYGSTEALDCVCYEIQSKQQVEKLEKIPLGLPTHNSIIYLLDNDTNEPTEEGEICVSGFSLADGYVGGRAHYAFTENLFRSDEKFKRLYHTGDFGFIRNGLLYFSGREDAQVKVDGNKVDLDEISAVVNKLDYVHECVTFTFHPSLPDQTIVSFIALRRYYDKAIVKEPEAIVSDLRELLIDFMIPKVFIVELMPRLNNGKIDKPELLRRYEDSLPKEEVRILNFSFAIIKLK